MSAFSKIPDMPVALIKSGAESKSISELPIGISHSRAALPILPKFPRFSLSTTIRTEGSGRTQAFDWKDPKNAKQILGNYCLLVHKSADQAQLGVRLVRVRQDKNRGTYAGVLLNAVICLRSRQFILETTFQLNQHECVVEREVPIKPDSQEFALIPLSCQKDKPITKKDAERLISGQTVAIIDAALAL